MSKTVHFYGDSFVAGVGDPAGLGWVGRISAAATDAGAQFRAVNHGFPGATSVAIVDHWLAATADDRNRGLPDTKAVFAFGTNDLIQAVPQARSLRALDDALERADDILVPALVIGPPPISDMPEIDAQLVELSAAFEDLCRSREVRFIATHEALADNSPWREEAIAFDGAHPQAGGYTAMASHLIRSGILDWIHGAVELTIVPDRPPRTPEEIDSLIDAERKAWES